MPVSPPQKRRVQLTGTSTLSVSLPKDWAVRNGVGQGSELYISEEGDGGLRVCTSDGTMRNLGEATIHVDTFHDSEEFRRTLLAKYLRGYTVIRLVSKDGISKSLRKEALREVDRLIGLEVTEEVKGQLVIQDFFSHGGLALNKILRRAHNITAGLQDDAIKAICEGDSDLASAVVTRDDEVDRLNYLFRRQISLALSDSSMLKNIGISAVETVVYSQVMDSIERIADISESIASYAVKNKSKPVSKGIKAAIYVLSERCRKFHFMALDAFFDKNLRLAQDLLLMMAEIEQDFDVLEKKVSSGDACTRVVLESMRRILYNASTIATSTLDRE